MYLEREKDKKEYMLSRYIIVGIYVDFKNCQIELKYNIMF